MLGMGIIAQIGTIITTLGVVFGGMTYILDDNARLRSEANMEHITLMMHELKDEIVKDVDSAFIFRVDQIENIYTLEEISTMVKNRVDDGFKSYKDYVDDENKEQESRFNEVYYLDDNDSIFKRLYYVIDGRALLISETPISTNDFNRINK